MAMIPGDVQQVLYCLPAGMVIGGFHFGGLWLTIHWLTNERSRGVKFAAGFVLRSFVTLTAVFMVSNGEWIGMTACLAGIWIMRKICIITLQPKAVGRTTKPVGHTTKALGHTKGSRT
jgi:F1F0 ATPase subunit 2